jgi:hypothetical protein
LQFQVVSDQKKTLLPECQPKATDQGQTVCAQIVQDNTEALRVSVHEDLVILRTKTSECVRKPFATTERFFCHAKLRPTNIESHDTHGLVSSFLSMLVFCLQMAPISFSNGTN